MAASEYVVSVVELPLSAATIGRMARAVESVDWEEMAREAYEAHGGFEGWPALPVEMRAAWISVSKAIYAQAARHIIAAACEVGTDAL